jgi:hypothetical protein
MEFFAAYRNFKFQFIEQLESLPLTKEVARRAGGRDKNVAIMTKF